jgi:hypothetical protein
MSEKKTIHKVTLVLTNGDSIEIYYDESITDEMFEEMHEHQDNGTLWHCDNWGDRIQARFKGNNLTHIDMSKVVGWA